MVNVFGQEIPWGDSREEVIPEYACVEVGKDFKSGMFVFYFDSDLKLNSISYRFEYETKVRALSQFFKLLEELTEKYGKPKIEKFLGNDSWRWKTKKTNISLEVDEDSVSLMYFQR